MNPGPGGSQPLKYYNSMAIWGTMGREDLRTLHIVPRGHGGGYFTVYFARTDSIPVVRRSILGFLSGRSNKYY